MKKKAYLCILSAAALWGFIAVFFKMLSAAGLTDMQAVAVRVTLAAVIYGIWLLFTDRQAFRIRLKDAGYFFGTGVLSLFLFNLCYFASIRQSSMSVAAVLLYTAPAFVMLMSAALFREKMTGRKIAALGLTFAGCLLVTGALGAGRRVTPMAALLGVGSGFFYALYSIFSKYALRRYSPSTITFYTFVFAAAAALPASGILGRLDLLTTTESALGAVGLAVICCLLPYFLYTSGLQNVEAGKASIMATLEPVVASALGICLYHDEATPLKLLGIALVVSAIVLLNVGGRRTQRE